MPGTIDLRTLLPYYARLDLAYTEEINVATPLGGQNTLLTGKAEYITIPLSIHFELFTSAAAGSRIPLLTLLDESARTIYELSSPVAQGASTNGFYTWIVGDFTVSSNVAVAGVAFVQMAVPDLPIYSKYILQIGVSNAAPLDSASNGAILNVLRIPTGPAVSEDHAAAAAVVTPVLF